MQKIIPFLWFNENAEEAANFYCSIFKNSKIESITHYGKNMYMPEGLVMSVVFKLEGQQFHALNGGSVFNFSPAISFFVDCKTQEEVDELWEKLSEGGEQQQCAWLKDKFGVSWQIVPSILGKLLNDPDPVKSQRVMAAMLKMTKIEIDVLQKAYEQE